MKIDLSIDDATGVVVVTAEGEIGADDVRDALVGVWQLPAFREGGRVLWDLQQADARQLDANALRHIALFEAKGRPEMPVARLAFLVARDMEFGLARMMGVFSEDERIDQNVFRDREEAWSWLAG